MLKRSFQAVASRRELYKARLVFYLIIASLGMFFLAAIASYCIIRTQAFQPIRYDYAPLRIPVAFWISTAVLLAISAVLHLAAAAIHRERRHAMERGLVAGFALAVVFLALQYWGLTELLAAHRQGVGGSTKAFGLCFTLALVHGLHVVAGIGLLGFVWVQTRRGRYDHERHWAVDHCAGYWHFLDAVWLVMLLAFVISR